MLSEIGESLYKICREDCQSPQLRAPEITSPGPLCLGPLPGRHSLNCVSGNNGRKEGERCWLMWLGGKAGGGELGDITVLIQFSLGTSLPIQMEQLDLHELKIKLIVYFQWLWKCKYTQNSLKMPKYLSPNFKHYQCIASLISCLSYFLILLPFWYNYKI